MLWRKSNKDKEECVGEVVKVMFEQKSEGSEAVAMTDICKKRIQVVENSSFKCFEARGFLDVLKEGQGA